MNGMGALSWQLLPAVPDHISEQRIEKWMPILKMGHCSEMDACHENGWLSQKWMPAPGHHCFRQWLVTYEAQTITWTNDNSLSIRPLGTNKLQSNLNQNEKSVHSLKSSSSKMYLKLLCYLQCVCHFCWGLNEYSGFPWVSADKIPIPDFSLTCGSPVTMIGHCFQQGPLLLTWFNFNPSMDK